MQLNNHHKVDVDAGAEDDVEMTIVEARTVSLGETTLDPINRFTANPLPRTPKSPSINLFDHYINVFHTPSSTPPTKRPASESSIRPLDLWNPIGPKRPRFDLSRNQTINPRIFNLNEDFLFSSDPDSMDLDFEPNTREYRKFLFRGFPLGSPEVLGNDSEYAISEEERQLLSVLEFSTMYRKKNLVLTEAEREEAMDLAVTYHHSLDEAGLPEALKKQLRKVTAERFEQKDSWNKIMTHLKNVQLGRDARLEWTELGLPRSELVKSRGSKSMPNLKIIASVKTKVHGTRLDQEEDSKEWSVFEIVQGPKDGEKPIFVPTNESCVPSLTAELTRTDLTATEHAKEQKEKTEIQQMLEVRSQYKITPRSPTPPSPQEKSSGQKAEADDESVFTYAHLQRYEKEFKKGTENSFTKEKEIQDNIRRIHAEHNKETFRKRQNDIWYAITPTAKINSWEKVPRDQHKYYTFGLREICDAHPEQRILFLEHNKLVEDFGQRKGDFKYECNDPFGIDTYLDDNPFILEGEDTGDYAQ
ncbi:hypothetical protein TWF225_011119 [Orbilia oligospora]|nr:hypothetical protein TWF225_011119 [Orbilia oligospora]KAF3248497.1 hypothetical protein TWF217_009096 [Orbilia oligospora]KAF3251282.1 hypothetical protein TWF128_007285 [Orbilia oligospora]KAF3288053.1 hypothetical protein TWF132_008033 [Orbilia oligospora]